MAVLQILGKFSSFKLNLISENSAGQINFHPRLSQELFFITNEAEVRLLKNNVGFTQNVTN